MGMGKEEHLNQENRPNIQQLQYLLELEKIDKKRGCVMQIAKTCGVSHSPVSRYLQFCCEKGYLTEDYEFTKLGKAWIGGYKKLIEELKGYLLRIGEPEAEVAENVRNLIENVSYHTLMSMMRNDQEMRRMYIAEKRGAVSKNFLASTFENGMWHVCFALYKRDSEDKISISMADRGFQKPATIRHNKRGSWLELRVCEMSARSRADGEEKLGHLETLKYEYKGMWCQVEVKEDKLRIPLDACRFQRKREGRIKGVIPVKVTCNVGRTHMPESTALLFFWM